MLAARPAAAPLPPPPRLRWPAIVQSLMGLFWVEGFPRYLLRRFEAEGLVTTRIVGVGDVVAVSDPESLKALFTAGKDDVHAGEANSQVLGLFGAGSLILSDGDPHLRLRRLVSPAFHGAAVLRYADTIAEITAMEVARWRSGDEIELLGAMQSIAIDAILPAVVGVRDSARLARLKQILPAAIQVNPLVVAAESRYPHLARGRAAGVLPWIRARHEVERLLHMEIAEHRSAPEGRDDVLAMLIAGAGLTDQELHDQLFTLLLAGHETTATSLAWCFERLLRHPKALARLLGEIAQGDGDEYLDAVISETLRTRPALDLAWRKLKVPMDLCGCRLEAGTMLAVSIRGAQNHASFSEPDRFLPERFLAEKPPPYTVIPFGGGSRRCIGAAFALMEIRTVLRTVLAAVELTAVSPAPERLSRTRSITTVPAKGARALVGARR